MRKHDAPFSDSSSRMVCPGSVKSLFWRIFVEHNYKLLIPDTSFLKDGLSGFEPGSGKNVFQKISWIHPPNFLILESSFPKDWLSGMSVRQKSFLQRFLLSNISTTTRKPPQQSSLPPPLPRDMVAEAKLWHLSEMKAEVKMECSDKEVFRTKEGEDTKVAQIARIATSRPNFPDVIYFSDEDEPACLTSGRGTVRIIRV